MRKTLGNRVTQWTRPGIDLEEAVKGVPLVEMRGILERLLLNMVTASTTTENRHGWNGLTAVATVATVGRTWISTGVLVQWAPLRSVTEPQTAGWMSSKMEGDGIFRITGERTIVMDPGGALHRATDRTP